MTFPPIRKDFEGLLTDTRDRLTIVERRLRGVGFIGDTAQVKAQLDPIYRGPGPAKVDFGDGAGLVGPYSWQTPYVPSGSRTVTVAFRRDASGALTPIIIGQDDGNKLPITLATGWGTYNDATSDNKWAAPTVSQRLSSGIVVLSGLIRNNGSYAAGSLIAQLPPGHRPDSAMVFGINSNDFAKYLTIHPNGDISFGEGPITTSWISLDGIAFPAAGVATWTPFDPQGTAGSDHTLANGWTNFISGGGSYGLASYWKDPYGFVWLSGMLKGGATADNTIMANLPTSHTAYKTHHIATASAVAGNTTSFFGVIGHGITVPGVSYKAGSVGNVWVSLSGATLVTPDAWNNNPWQQMVLANGWLYYNPPSDYPSVSTLRRGDGLGVLHGMMRAGTIAARAMFIPAVAIPPRRLLMQTVSNAARGRIDIHGYESDGGERGAFIPQQGGNPWFSTDSIKYMV